MGLYSKQQVHVQSEVIGDQFSSSFLPDNKFICDQIETLGSIW